MFESPHLHIPSLPQRSASYPCRSSNGGLCLSRTLLFFIFISIFQTCFGLNFPSTLLNINSPKPIQISSTLEVRIESFVNTNKATNGRPPVYRFCVRQSAPPANSAQLWTTGDSKQACPLGRSTIISSNTGDNFPLTAAFSSPFSWPESFSLVVEVAENDNANIKSLQSGIEAASINAPATEDDDDDNDVDESAAISQSRNNVNSGSQLEKGVLLRMVVQRKSLLSGGNWTVESASTSSASLTISFRLRCAADMYGSDCTKYCVPRDNDFGHYTCNLLTGNPECLSGWTSSSRDEQKNTNNNIVELKKASALACTSAVCKPGCSLFGGLCNKPGECRCREGWTGENCDMCRVKPSCKHGTCVKPGDCLCDNKWTGENCDKPVNPCSTSGQRCMENGGQCTNLVNGSYECTCPFRRSGKDCDIVTSFCNSSPCLNGGTCIDVDEKPGYMCTCSSLTTGLNCETIIARRAAAVVAVQQDDAQRVSPTIGGVSVPLMTDSSNKVSGAVTESLSSTHLALIIAFGVVGPCASLFIVGVIVALRARRRRLQRQHRHIIVQSSAGTIPTVCAVAVPGGNLDRHQQHQASKKCSIGTYSIAAATARAKEADYKKGGCVGVDEAGCRPWSFSGELSSLATASGMMDNLRNSSRQGIEATAAKRQDEIDLAGHSHPHQKLAPGKAMDRPQSSLASASTFPSTNFSYADFSSGSSELQSSNSGHSINNLSNMVDTTRCRYFEASTAARPSTSHFHATSHYPQYHNMHCVASDFSAPGRQSLLPEDGRMMDLPPPYSPPSSSTLEDCV